MSEAPILVLSLGNDRSQACEKGEAGNPCSVSHAGFVDAHSPTSKNIPR